MPKSAVAVATLIVLVIAAAAYQLLRPVPIPQMQSTLSTSFKVPGTLKVQWPSQGAGALEVSGVGVMGSSNGNQVMPLASVAKMMTAYIVLKDHPLSLGANGPSVTITAADVATYQSDLAQRDSVAPVAIGEKLTERQLLEALLLPSGDNIATLLAEWDAGSVSSFVQKMNQAAKTLGMTRTHYADPAGINPASAGSALDQMKLAETDMNMQAFQTIVRMPQATLPFGGVVYNTDYVLGHNGIIGVKTGSMPQAGGNFVFATKSIVGGKRVLVIGCVLGQQGHEPLIDALNAGEALAKQATQNLESVTLVADGTKTGIVSSAWGQSSDVVTTKSVSTITWPGMVVLRTVKEIPLGKTVDANTTVAQLALSFGRQTVIQPLKTTQSISAPSLKWKLLH